MLQGAQDRIQIKTKPTYDKIFNCPISKGRHLQATKCKFVPLDFGVKARCELNWVNCKLNMLQNGIIKTNMHRNKSRMSQYRKIQIISPGTGALFPKGHGFWGVLVTKKINLERCGLKFDEICVLVTVKPAPSGVDYYFFFWNERFDRYCCLAETEFL